MLFVKNSNAIQNQGMASKRRDLNWIEVEAHQNLKRIWSEKKQALGLTQESAADELGYKTQGAVSQYLNGRVPLNLPAILGFAKLLGVKPHEISKKLVPIEFMSDGSVDMSVDEPTETVRAAHLLHGTQIVGSNLVEKKALYRSLNVPVINKKNILERINLAELTPENHKVWCPTKSVSINAFALSVDELPTPTDRFGFHPNAFIVVDPDYSLESGKLVLTLDSNNLLSIKRYEIHGQEHYLGSYNENYKPILLDETYQIIGRVAGSYQEF